MMLQQFTQACSQRVNGSSANVILQRSKQHADGVNEDIKAVTDCWQKISEGNTGKMSSTDGKLMCNNGGIKNAGVDAG